MIESWVEVDDRIFAATLQMDGHVRLRLSVERLPGGGWDWTVWSSHRDAQYGAAASLDVAMSAAEEAAASVGGMWWSSVVLGLNTLAATAAAPFAVAFE